MCGVAWLFAALTTGCASNEAESKHEPQAPVLLTVWNSTECDIEDLRVHDGPTYAGASNLLTDPLPDDGRIDVQLKSGQRVTAMRRNVEGGHLIAFTTANGLAVDADGYMLQVFQESFRLLPPSANDGFVAHPDGGPGGDP